MVDGRGEKGIVSAETVRAQNPDQYREAMVFPRAVADNREDIQKLKRELMNHGVKFSVFDTVNPMDGSPAVSIGIQGRDMDIMTQALINIGVESFGMDRKELEECARGIERDDQDRYPRAFKRNGINWEFERTGDGRNSWVGSAGGHSRAVPRDPRPGRREQGLLRMHRNGRPVASAEVDATQGPELWKTGSDGAKEFYNEMKAEGGRVRGRARHGARGRHRPRLLHLREQEEDRPEAGRGRREKNAALLSEALGNSRAASPESPVGQTKAAKKIAESKMQPSMPARNEGMHR